MVYVGAKCGAASESIVNHMQRPIDLEAGKTRFRQPKIAFFIRALAGGGASRDSILLANAVADQGRSVSILTLRPEGPLRALVAPHVDVVPVGAGKLRTAIPALALALVRLRPDVLASAEAAPNLVAMVATRLLPRAYRPKLVLREVSSPSEALRLPVYRSNWIGYKAAGHVYARADLALTLTAGAKRDLVENFAVPEAKVSVMSRNAVITAETAAILSGAEARPEREPGLIVCVGRLSPEKDQPTLVKAMSLMGEHPTAHLALAGSGALEGEVRALIATLGLEQRVTLLGHVSDPFPLLQRAELAVCPSRYEGFGNAIVEALACGTPVVATDCPHGPREILQDGTYGRLVPVGDARALADAMAEALAGTPDRERLRARGLRFATEAAAREFLGLVAAI